MGPVTDMAFQIEQGILDRAVAGDSAALDNVLRTIRPSVERQLLRYPVSDEDRRDLLQATLMQIVRRLGSFRAESSFSTWLFRVTANEALMLMRSRRRHRARVVEGLDWEELATLPAVNDSTSWQSDLGAGARERDARVRSALSELPADYRDVVVAHYHMDLGLQEIADKLDISESAVRSRLHRARTRLRSLLERETIDYDAAA
jgi:RNA polymerase sigma-70 factor (ECF subfamily)